MVDLHHLDRTHSNNDPENLIGLCPNHHKMVHMDKHSKEIEMAIQKKLTERDLVEPIEISG